MSGLVAWVSGFVSLVPAFVRWVSGIVSLVSEFQLGAWVCQPGHWNRQLGEAAAIEDDIPEEPRDFAALNMTVMLKWSFNFRQFLCICL